MPENVIHYEVKEPAPPPPPPTREEVLQAVQQAAREGSTRSLERLNGKALSQMPEYRTDILPILKNESLTVLLRRFSESDWVDWPRSSFILEGSPTPARTYVNDVFIVNEDLGRFLETMALLFHVSYSAATEGKILQPEAALERVFAQADRLLAYRTPKAIPARNMLDPEALSNPFVIDRLKQVRSGLVLRYLRAHPKEYMLQFELLSRLPNESVNSEVNEALANLLHRFSLEASPTLRKDLLEQVLSAHAVAERARADGRVSRALAHLFLMGVVDALEANDARRADIYLDESYNLNPHLPAQDVVADAIRQVNAKALEKGKEPAPAAAPEKGAKKAKEQDADSPLQLLASSVGEGIKPKSSFIEQAVKLLFYLLIALLLGGGAFLFFLYRRGLKTSGEDIDVSLRDPVDISITSGTEIPFSSERNVGNSSTRSPLRAAASSV